MVPFSTKVHRHESKTRPPAKLAMGNSNFFYHLLKFGINSFCVDQIDSADKLFYVTCTVISYVTEP